MKTREELLAEQQAQDSGGISQFIAGLGGAFAGRDPARIIDDMRAADEKRKQQALAQYDATQERARQDVLNQRTDADYNRNLEITKQEQDPTSYQSQMAQELAVKMGMDPEKAKGLTAEKFKNFSPALEKMYQFSEKAKSDKLAADDRAAARAESAAERASRDEERRSRDARDYADRQEREKEKQSEKNFALTTPYGLANTPDDAKQLKEAIESKKNFDNKIQEMIDLRKQYGGELLNREAVARGKQLSKDLLLEYKNMAKLGVLSKSDEDIINAIIPEDPLAFQSASLLGQDPILHKLEKFKSDSDKDFATRIQTRIRGGGTPEAKAETTSTPETKVINGKTYRKVPGGWEEQ